MSTDHQRFSIENQAVVIAAYAQLHNLSIVRTYRDEGESGLTIKNRTGLFAVTFWCARTNCVPQAGKSAHGVRSPTA